MIRDFDEWLMNFKNTIVDWDYYVNFPKVYSNVESIKVELNILNSLIGSKDIETEFKSLATNYPEIIKVIPILIAKREKEIAIADNKEEFFFNFNQPNYSIDEYCNFMRKTGLFNLLENHLVGDLTDYVKGIEVGLDSNARKNRTGHLMEDIVEKFIVDAGYEKNNNYFKELKKTEIEKKYDVDLSALSGKWKTNKRFDFVIKSEKTIYVIETNYYSGGGSKLNETARSYEMLGTQAKSIENFEFIWITDGQGWKSAKNNLRQTLESGVNVLSLKDLEEGILSKIIK
ncbi:type II restriction endonuclease [Erysipelothrix inopinata]|uniref:type II restriction endonuclease n=1 Tax=Erysipelothrix inopinata TaxID=225084 RepID=UPI001CB6D00D|nr:type II restriction endonuclease [Erysipelothrix inopinata]